MLDTDTCIYSLRQAPGFRLRLPLHECGVSVVVLGELEWGLARSSKFEENEATLRDFTASVQVEDLDSEVAQQYGRLRAHLYAAGRPIGPNDFWIAAHALARDVPLITHNLSEFRRVPDLSVDTWMTA